MTNKQRIQAFNALHDAGMVESVCAQMYPSLGGFRADFYREGSLTTGWLIATDAADSTRSKDFVYRVPVALIDAAEALEFDPFDDAAYMKALLAMSDEFRSAQ